MPISCTFLKEEWDFLQLLLAVTSNCTSKASWPFSIYVWSLCTTIARQIANFLLVEHHRQMCNSCGSSADGPFQRSRTAWRKLDSSPSTFGSGRCQTPSLMGTPRNTMPTEMWSTKNRSVSIKEMLGTPTSLELQICSRRMVHSATQMWWNLVALSFQVFAVN